MLAALLVVAMVPLAATPAAAEGPSQLSLTKTASVTTVAPGETFSYTLEVGCSAVDVGTGCTNATLTDSVPAEFEVVSVTVGTGLSAQTPVVSGQDVTVVFNSPLADPPGAIGLPASATGVVTITVSRADEMLQLQVRDNGRGLKTATGGQIAEGVGLSNIRARLRELAGDTASLQIGSPAEGEFAAEIRLPWRTIPSRASQA